MDLTSSWLLFSDEGERAVRAANRLRAFVASSEAQITSTVPLALRPSYPADLYQLALVRAWGILESYLARRGHDTLRADLPVSTSPNDTVRFVHTLTLDTFERGYKKMVE